MLGVPPPCAFIHNAVTRKRADISLLIIVFIYFKILVLTVSPLSDTILTT
ncbi:hypothetical protein J2780_003787 [Chryseobacterium camelliae]|nr:hypothetical protein [Chryseobacterium camelliae]